MHFPRLHLKHDQRVALLLQAAGFCYEEIGAGRRWSYTKVNRCVNEGRAALRVGTASASEPSA